MSVTVSAVGALAVVAAYTEKDLREVQLKEAV
jgi:hypothetical protein